MISPLLSNLSYHHDNYLFILFWELLGGSPQDGCHVSGHPTRRGQGEDEQATLTDSERYGRNNGAILCIVVKSGLRREPVYVWVYEFMGWTGSSMG